MRRSLRDLVQISRGAAQNLQNCEVDAVPSAFQALRALSSQGASSSGRPNTTREARPSQAGARPQALGSAAIKADGFSAIPPIPKFLGLAGAIPFLALSPPIAAGLPFLPADLVANAALLQIGYGATIASFLGGIHWALAMANVGTSSALTNRDRYLWSVTPCLLAWPAVILEPGPGSLVVGSTLGIVYIMDRNFAKQGLLPPWYMALRKPLTLVAVGGLMTTCVASIVYHDQGVGNPQTIPAGKSS